jgi:hypothetical protein
MHKLFNIALLTAFLFVYLDWGHDGSEFIWQLESSIFSGPDYNIGLLANPLFILAFIGQVLLIAATIKTQNSRRVTTFGVVLLSGIVILVLIMGLLVLEIKTILSTVPFLILVLILIMKWRNSKNQGSRSL